MVKWFDDALDTRKVRSYTRRQLTPGLFGFSRRLSITTWLIISNVVAFIAMLVLFASIGEVQTSEWFAIHANLFFAGSVWTVVTSMFLHAGFGHLLANMVSLFFLGSFVEKIIGRKRFLAFYLISGIVAGLFYVFLAYFFGASVIGEKLFGSPDTFAVGASGAIFALAGLLAVLTPRLSVYLVAGPIIAIIVQSLLPSFISSGSILSLVNVVVSVYVIFAIFAIFSFNPSFVRWAVPIQMPFWVLPIVAIVPLVIIGLFVPLPIGNSAHFGGLVAGLVYAQYLRRTYVRKTAQLRRHFGG